MVDDRCEALWQRDDELVLSLTEDARALLGAALATTPAVAPGLATAR